MIPINYLAQHVRTSEQWRAYRRQFCPRMNSINSAARHYARKHGKAIIFHCDDSATIIETSPHNKSGLTVHRLKPSQVSWHSDSMAWDNGWNAYGQGTPCVESFPLNWRKGWHAARAYYLESIAA